MADQNVEKLLRELQEKYIKFEEIQEWIRISRKMLVHIPPDDVVAVMLTSLIGSLEEHLKGLEDLSETHEKKFGRAKPSIH